MNRNKKPDVHKDNGVITMYKNVRKTDKCAVYAPNRERNYYNDYAEDMLLPEEIKDFKQHLKTCEICQSEVTEAQRIHDIVKQSPRLSEVGLKRSVKRNMQYRDEILARNAANLEFAEDAAMLPLAASPPRRLDCHGVAYGVAVNSKSNQGALLECIASIGALSRVDCELEIIAKECITTTRDGLEIKITPPTSYLENLLKAMFRHHPILKPFRLYKKSIFVEVNYKSGSGYIYESDSVALAVLVSILSAATGKPVDKDILFSAGIKLNGYLEGVGDLEQKIEIAKQQCMKACYTADETRPISAKQTIEKSGVALHFFDKLEDVLGRLGLVGQNKAGKQKSSQTRTKKR